MWAHATPFLNSSSESTLMKKCGLFGGGQKGNYPFIGLFLAGLG
jgi:hypothetical protein